MRTYTKFLFFALATLLLAACSSNETAETKTEKETSMLYQKTDIQPPVAAKKPKELSMHGDTRIDNYYWLNDREDQEVLDYLTAENTYKDSMMSHLKDLQEDLFQEIKGRIKENDMSVPYLSNGYYYYVRYEEGKEYPIYCRKPESLDNDEEVMLDVNVMAEPYPYYQVGGMSVSPDNKILSFGVDTLSRRIYTIHFKNLETGEVYEQAVPQTTGRAVWANDNKTVFFSKKDEALRSFKIFSYNLGDNPDNINEIWHEQDETFSTYVWKTKSKDYIMISSFQTVSTEHRYLDANDPTGSFKTIQARERHLEYGVDHFGDHWYIRTNMDAQNFRLMKAPLEAPGKENWEEVIAHRKDVLLEGFEIFSDHLVLSERIQGITQLRIRPWDGSEEHYIDFGEEAFNAYVSVNREFDTDVLRVGFTSLKTPNSVYDYNMNTRKLDLKKQQEVVGGYSPENYETKRLYATARDGVKVPISLVYHKDTPIDGSAPLLLYGYGSYGYSIDPSFSSVRLSLLDRGFVWAIAHIRGGEDMGRAWYEDGKLLNKKNTFTDFIDCGNYLVEEKYAAEDQLFAMGGSAGGLLMGAIVNMNPDMWKGIVAAVPFVDVVTTMLDESIPLTTGEYDEWGNPNEEEYYNYILSYSPYDQVEARDYPAMMVTTGLHDSQVQYWEPAKWVAKLRELKTDDNPLVLHTNMETGHSGASGRFERYKETAMEYAFLLDLAGKALEN
ncbi:MAG: S9 family peptidase [Bacteroidetes bacterium]|nr:S9 family peptidase [Bacteroidota bacterium]